MNPKTHLGYEVSDIHETIEFYQQVLGASIEFINVKKRSASLKVNGCEINLFERIAFGGYHKSLLRSLHIGFQLSSKKEVDVTYKKALVKEANPIGKPFKREDGDYSLFLQDPDGMQVEVFYGTHAAEREKYSKRDEMNYD